MIKELEEALHLVRVLRRNECCFFRSATLLLKGIKGLTRLDMIMYSFHEPLR